MKAPIRFPNRASEFFANSPMAPVPGERFSQHLRRLAVNLGYAEDDAPDGPPSIPPLRGFERPGPALDGLDLYRDPGEEG